MNDPIGFSDPSGASPLEATYFDDVEAKIAAHFQAEREQQLFESSYNLGVIWTQFRVSFDDQTIANMGLNLNAVKLGAHQWNEFVQWHKIGGVDFETYREFQRELFASRQITEQVREHPIRTPLLITAKNGGKALVEAALIAIPGAGEAGLVERAAVEATFAEPLLAEAAAAERAAASAAADAQTIFRVEGGIIPNASKLRFQAGDGGTVSIAGDDMLFVNLGQEGRALEFLAKRGETAELVRFDVTPEFAARLRSAAVPQRLGRQFPGRPQIVDPTRAPDQFGIPSSMFRDLLDNIVPGTFRRGRP
jgi:hypothetical protein